MDEIEALRLLIAEQSKRIGTLEAQIALAVEFLQGALSAIANVSPVDKK